MTIIELAAPFTRVQLSTTAAMVLDAAFTLGERTVHPLARADWVGSGSYPEEAGHMRELAGEFVGVPFGSAGAPDSAVAEWDGLIPSGAPSHPHGPAANDEWYVVATGEGTAVLGLDYPADSPIERLERTISLRQDAPAIDFTLRITAKRACATSIGLHPIVRLPEREGDLELSIGFTTGYTYPGHVYPGRGATAPGRTFDSLTSIPARSTTTNEGTTVDLTRLPLGPEMEDVVLLAGAQGPLVVTFHDDETRLQLDWDQSILPHLLVWVSDRALRDEPWCGRYRGIGLEPLAAAFDLPDSVSVGSNPLSEAGFVTSVALDRSAPTVIRYSLEMSSLDS